MLSFGASKAQNCWADFQYSVNNSTVSFYDSSFSSSGNHSYYWTFGNGSTSNQSNPVYTYNQSGTYQVCLAIIDSSFAGSCYDSICYMITVGNIIPRPCNASYTYSANGNVVSFTNTSASSPAMGFTYSWDFGDGSPASTAINPTHTYAAGAYIATLTATGAGATCMYYDTVFTGSISNPCAALFTYQSSPSGSFSFINQSTGGGAFSSSYFWNFGDGNTSTAFNPTHTYNAAGTYVVSLTLSDSLNNCNSTYYDTVNYQVAPPRPCNANFTVVKDSSVAFGVILYNNSTNLATHTYSWNFGDGTTGSGRTPSHQYQSFGAYYVCLTITDSSLNCVSTFCDTVGMDTNGNLKAGFGLTVQNGFTTSINEVDQLNDLSIYPNPATRSLSLDMSDLSGTLNVQIFDLSGRVVIENNNTTTGNIEKIDITTLNNGIYFISINDGKNQKIQKFIKSE